MSLTASEECSTSGASLDTPPSAPAPNAGSVISTGVVRTAGDVMDLERTLKFIAAEEGCRLQAYRDSLGIWTIGYGFNLISHGHTPEEAAAVRWTQAEADTALRDEVTYCHLSILKRWPWASSLNDVRLAVLIGMAFQLGVDGLAKFKRTLAAFEGGRWDDAGQYMAESLWAKQCPARASRAIRITVSGEWPKKVNGVQVA